MSMGLKDKLNELFNSTLNQNHIVDVLVDSMDEVEKPNIEYGFSYNDEKYLLKISLEKRE